MTDEPGAENPYAAPPPGQQPPSPPPYVVPPAYGAPAPYAAPSGLPPQQPPYAAPPGWQPAPPPWGVQPDSQPPPPPGATTSVSPPYGAPSAWAPQQSGYPNYGWAPGYPPYGYPQQSQHTNGFAIAALVCSIVLSFAFGIGGILGVVFGIMGLRECRTKNERGRGLAIAGIVIGGVVIAIWILGAIGLAVGNHHSNTGNGLGA